MKIRIFCEKMLRSPTSIVTKIYKLNQLRFLTIAVISFSCQENRLPEELDNDFKPSVVDAIISPVEIDFTSSPNVEENLVKNLIGTFSPQKWVHADKIYHRKPMFWTRLMSLSIKSIFLMWIILLMTVPGMI